MYIIPKRNYKTWEEDFLSSRYELFGFEGELVAIVDKDEEGWFVKDHTGTLIARRGSLNDCIALAE